MRSSPRMRTAAATTIEPMFRRIDTDRDGFLSLAEYRKSFPPRPGGAAARPGSPKEKPPGANVPDARITAEQEAFFEAKIRPVLATQCGKCHASTALKLRGGLKLDSREALRLGGDSGPAIVPGNPDESLLVRAIRYRDEELRMPPKAQARRRRRRRLRGLGQDGRPRPQDRADRGVAARPSIDLAKAREFWSFRPPKKSAPPAVKRADWPRGDIDRFLLAALESRGLAAGRRRRPAEAPSPGDVRPHRPAADARGARCLPRATTPPTPSRKVVDRLLASPRFGERWGRHWLDVARYRRVERQDELHLSPGLALSRLGHRLIQRRQALRPVRPRADRRRPASRPTTTASGPNRSSRPASSPSAARPTTPRTAGSSSWTSSTSRSRRPRAPSSA